MWRRFGVEGVVHACEALFVGPTKTSSVLCCVLCNAFADALASCAVAGNILFCLTALVSARGKYAGQLHPAVRVVCGKFHADYGPADR